MIGPNYPPSTHKPGLGPRPLVPRPVRPLYNYNTSVTVGTANSSTGPFSTDFDYAFQVGFSEFVGNIKQVLAIRSALDPEISNITKLVGKLAHTIDTQTISVKSVVSRVYVVTTASSAKVRNLVNKFLSGVISEVSRVTRSTIFSKLYNVAMPAVSSRLTGVRTILVVTSSESSGLMRLINHIVVAIDSQISGTLRLVGKTLSVINLESLSLIKMAGKLIPSATTQTFNIIRSMRHNMALVSGQSISLQRFSGRVLSASNAISVSALKLISRLFSAAFVNIANMARLPSLGRSYNASSAQNISVLRAITHTISTVSSEITRLRAAISRTLFSTISQSASTLKSINKFLALTLVNILGLARQPSIGRSYSAASPQIISALLFGVGKILSALSQESFSIKRSIGHITSAIISQVGNVFKLIARILSAADSEVAFSIQLRAQLKNVSAASTEIVLALPRGVGKIVSAIDSESIAIKRFVGKFISIASLVVANYRQASSRILTLSNSQSTRALRQISHILSGVDAEASSASRSASRILSVSSAQIAASIKATGKAVAAALVQIPRNAVKIAKATGAAMVSFVALVSGRDQAKPMSLGQAQATTSKAGSPIHIISVSVISQTIQSMVKAANKAFVISQAMAELLAEWGHRFLPVQKRHQVANLPWTNSWSVSSGPQTTTLPPSVRSVVLPKEDTSVSGFTNVEPPFFSPFDPSDEESVTFDWTNRAYPNDTLVFASVASVPSGLNLIGPAFIDGYAVEQTLGPFTPPYTPITYGVRCTAIFSSGRVSNYTVAIEVRPL